MNIEARLLMRGFRAVLLQRQLKWCHIAFFITYDFPQSRIRFFQMPFCPSL